MNLRSKIIPVVVTLVILYVAATQLNWGALLSTLQKADVSKIGLAMVVWLFLISFKSLKWQQIVGSVEGTIGFFESAMVLFIGLFVSVITPGRAGDFVRALYLKDRLDMGRGVLAVVIDRAIDILSLLIFAGIGIALLAQSGGISFITPLNVAMLIVGSCLALYLFFNRRIMRKWVWPLVRRILPSSLHSLIQKYGNQFYDAVPTLFRHVDLIFIGVICSTIAWLLTITFGWTILQALGYHLDWTAALMVIPILALVEIIPVGILGLGTREIAAIIVLGAFGVSPEGAVAFSLTYFALGYIPSFIIGAICFNRNPIPLPQGFGGIFSSLKGK
ncbi:MAG: lysylphosphatidylglycerol synthase transmembrane domain-containing protein [archaeon]